MGGLVIKPNNEIALGADMFFKIRVFVDTLSTKLNVTNG